MKNAITLILALFLFNAIPSSAQINTPKNNSVKGIQLKKGPDKNLKLLSLVNDGLIYEKLDGKFMIHFAKGGVSCCYKTEKAAINAYPNKKLIVVTSGNMGFVYDEKTNKKIPNAQIVFRKENSTVSQYAHSNTNGRYKIGLTPECAFIKSNCASFKATKNDFCCP